MSDNQFYTDVVGKDWLNPIAVLDLRAAVQDRKDTVVLDGKFFTLQYHDNISKVFVRIVGNFAPCGWFTYEELERYEFEADHDKHL